MRLGTCCDAANIHNKGMSNDAAAQEGPSGPNAILMEAIVRMRCISATYNRKRMILAPHILYMRNAGLYTDAFVVSRENMLPREAKFGTFKIDGFSELSLTQRAFSASDLFDPKLDKYIGAALLAIEPESAFAA